eukprot:GHVU01066941.1.p1 GENE.GHVU01066941.1~~GHVU01066941.1.p1  ORF type:complete len:318 (+),score=47.50 GHVU01066941.1:277-1230(+)
MAGRHKVIVLFNANPVDWAAAAKTREEAAAGGGTHICFDDAFSAAVVYLRLLEASSWGGIDAAFIAFHASGCELLFDGSPSSQEFDLLRSKLVEFLSKQDPKHTMLQESCIGFALSRAIFYGNSFLRQHQDNRLRVLLFSISLRVNAFSRDFNPLINLAFAAAAMRVAIDVCAIGIPAPVVQMVAEVSGGAHVGCEYREGQAVAEPLLGLLLMRSFPSAGPMRQSLSFPKSEPLSRSCVCALCKQPFRLAYVCSCCLASHCGEQCSFKDGLERSLCAICKARFRHREAADTIPLSRVRISREDPKLLAGAPPPSWSA